MPRKLNRVGELFGLCLDVARENGWPLRQRRQQLTVLRLVIVQLPAPDLYRFAARHDHGFRNFLSKLGKWCEEYSTPVNPTLIENNVRTRIEENTKALKEKPDDPEAVGKLYTLRRLDLQLLKLVRQAQQHRSRFDPFDLIDLNNRCDDGIHRYFNLEPSAVTLRPVTGKISFTPGDMTMQAKGVTAAPETVQIADERIPAAPSDPDGFFNQLFSTDEIAWRNAIEQEAERLTGRVLDDPSFRALLDRVRRAPQVVSVRWVELLEPYLTADQFVALYRESKLLQRLNDDIQGAKPS